VCKLVREWGGVWKGKGCVRAGQVALSVRASYFVRDPIGKTNEAIKNIINKKTCLAILGSEPQQPGFHA